MPAFKRRSRRERRNRAYKTLLRRVAKASGFPTRSRNQRRWLRSFLPKLQQMMLVESAYTRQLQAGLDAIRDFGIVDFDIKTCTFNP